MLLRFKWARNKHRIFCAEWKTFKQLHYFERGPNCVIQIINWKKKAKKHQSEVWNVIFIYLWSQNQKMNTHIEIEYIRYLLLTLFLVMRWYQRASATSPEWQCAVDSPDEVFEEKHFHIFLCITATDFAVIRTVQLSHGNGLPLPSSSYSPSV